MARAHGWNGTWSSGVRWPPNGKMGIQMPRAPLEPASRTRPVAERGGGAGAAAAGGAGGALRLIGGAFPWRPCAPAGAGTEMSSKASSAVP